MRVDEAKQILKEHGYKVQSLTKLFAIIYPSLCPSSFFDRYNLCSHGPQTLASMVKELH